MAAQLTNSMNALRTRTVACTSRHSPTAVRLPLPRLRRPAATRRRVTTAALETQNLFVSILASGVGGAVAAAVTTITSEDRDLEIERLQTVEGASPLAAAVLVDAVVHSTPGLNVLLGLLSEPAGAACGVAYIMAFILSAPSVDPTTFAPAGTLLNAEKAKDTRGVVRVPFTRIIPTLIKAVDFSNDSSSGKGWTVEDGIPKLPITSVAIVLGVGTLILEAASHAPVLSLFMPRVLQVAGWLAAVGFVLDKRGETIASKE